MQDPIVTLKTRIQSSDSMTETLRLWCMEHNIGQGALRSDFVPGSVKRPPSAEAIAALRLRKSETTRLRRIVLMRGEAGLLEADNWYVPGRLPKAANDILEQTNTPFGAVFPCSDLSRRTLFCDTEPVNPGIVHLRELPQANKRPILTVRAVVMLNGTPIAFVEERLRSLLISGMNPRHNAQSA